MACSANRCSGCNASEGTTADEARAGIDQLLAANVDAVIGPASSLVALEVLDELMAEGVVVCSPTATALALNDYPDRDLFFRTVPSDSLTAQAMAARGPEHRRRLLRRRVPRRPVRPSVRPADDRHGSTRPEVEPSCYERPFPSDATPEELAEIATELAELAPRTIVLIADSRHGWAMLQAMAGVFASDPPFIFINDAMRDPAKPRRRDRPAGRVPREDPGRVAGGAAALPPEAPSWPAPTRPTPSTAST